MGVNDKSLDGWLPRREHDWRGADRLLADLLLPG